MCCKITHDNPLAITINYFENAPLKLNNQKKNFNI